MMNILRTLLTYLNMGSFQIFKQYEPRIYVIVLCFQKHNVQYKKGPLLGLPAAKSTSCGINSVIFRACLPWNSFPQSIKHSESIVELKTKMKDLGNFDCSCILCQ